MKINNKNPKIQKMLLWGALIPVITSVSTIVSCNKKDVKSIKKDQEKKLSPMQLKINALINDIKNHLGIKNKYIGKDFKSDPNAAIVVEIFKKHGIEINLNNGTSKKSSYIGNKYGNISYFINNLIDKSQDELNKISINNIGSLFIKDAKNDKYSNIPSITNIFKKSILSVSNSVLPSLTNRPAKVISRKVIKDSYYNDASSLKQNDKFWTIPSNSYSSKATIGLGQTFYKDLSKNRNDKWNIQFDLSNWINVYDTKFEEITKDPNHIYKIRAPKGYKSQASGFYQIYTNKENGKTRTGNNNNGLNGLYSGALFSAEGNEKTFDIKTILSEDEGVVVLSLTKKSKILLGNGWEHVSPASKAGDTFNQHRKRPITDAFKYALGDFHNIRPSFQQFFNNPRQNFHYGMVPENNNKYFGIDFEIGDSVFNLKVTEPRISVRGDVARIIFYMHDRYHIKYDLNYYKMLLLWARMDPVTLEEHALDAKIKVEMGFSNDYVTGAKKLPFDQQVESMIINANKDTTSNIKTPTVANKVMWSRTSASKINAWEVENPMNNQKIKGT